MPGSSSPAEVCIAKDEIDGTETLLVRSLISRVLGRPLFRLGGAEDKGGGAMEMRFGFGLGTVVGTGVAECWVKESLAAEYESDLFWAWIFLSLLSPFCGFVNILAN